MTLRGKKILLKPLNPVKLRRYTDGEATLEQLLELDGLSGELDGVDLSDCRERCEADPGRDYWFVPWIVIRKIDRVGLCVLRCLHAPNDRHEVMLSFPNGDEFFEEKCEAFSLLCEWAAGHDKVYFLRTVPADGQNKQIAFLQTIRFKKINDEGLFEAESAPSAWLPILLAVGLGFGTGIGEILGSMPLGSALGLMGGFFLGSYLDKKNKEARQRK